MEQNLESDSPKKDLGVKKLIWNSMLDADLNYRYYSHLCRRYYIRDKYAKVFLAIMSSGTVASWGIWSNIEIVWKMLSALSALLAGALPILDWSKIIENMGKLSQQWFQIKTDYEFLWMDIDHDNCNINNEQIETEFKKIKQKECTIQQEELPLAIDDKLRYKCTDEVLISRKLK